MNRLSYLRYSSREGPEEIGSRRLGGEVALEPRSELSEAGFEPSRVERIRTYFDHFVAAGRVAGWLVTLSRGGQLVWSARGGERDRERGLGVTDDTIWRLYSMTKPVTAVGALMLYEEGAFDLNDEVSRWIPELAEPTVYLGGPVGAMRTRPAATPIRVHHLFTHTAGLTYGFQNTNPVDALYRSMGYDETRWVFPEGIDLEGAVGDWARAPLLFDPGTAWNYSVSIDVLGRLVEIWSGERLDAFVARRLLEPLGMSDTTWSCREADRDRLAMLYVNWEGQAVAVPDLAEAATKPPALLAGGGGLLSTAADYERFMAMLVGGGALDGVRYLRERTVALMGSNFLAGGGTLAEMSCDSFSEVGQAGVGYGLGVATMVDPVANRSLVSPGTISWGGAASTYFWVDRTEGLSAALYAQLLPSTSYPWRRALQQLVYSAMLG